MGRVNANSTMCCELQWSDVYLAAHVGVMRFVYARRSGRTQVYGQPRDDWGADCNGALAEYAWSKLTNQYWSAFDRQFLSLPGDVGQVQIRSTRLANGGLTLHPKDRDEQVFVLALIDLFSKPVTVKFVGWIRGLDGKAERFWDKTKMKRPCFLVPQSELRSMEELQ